MPFIEPNEWINELEEICYWKNMNHKVWMIANMVILLSNLVHFLSINWFDKNWREK